MLKLLRKSKFFIFLLIFINISSSLFASEQRDFSTKSKSSFEKGKDIIEQLYDEDGILLFDSIMRLFEEIENGLLDDICTKKDWDKINQFIVYLARLGMKIYPTVSEEELEEDIKELLDGEEEKPFEIENFLSPFSFNTNVNKKEKVILCSNIFKKPVKKVKKATKKTARFVKKHPILATVGVASFVGGVYLIKNIIDSKKDHSLNKNPSTKQPTIDIPHEQEAEIKKSVEDSLTLFKETIEQNEPADITFKKENIKNIGAAIIHENLYDRFLNQSENLKENNYIKEHGKIDKAFSTDQAWIYLDENNMLKNSEKHTQENLFYLQGHQALKENYYDKAIDNFSKAIETNPQNHNIYLDRAYAYLQDGQFDQSINDYRIFSEAKNTDVKSKTTLIDCVDFTMGMTTGITKGAVESGKQLISFAANAIVHPANTYSSFVESIQMISDLAKDNEWKTLSKIVFPEVCELIDNWDNFTPQEKGEKSGYIVGKYGADILVPGVAAKAISQGIKGAKELAIIAKNLQNTEKVIVLEALTETGGRSGTFAETVYAWKTTKSTINTVEKHSKNITNLITSKTLNSSKKIIDNVIKETIETKGFFTSKYGLTYNEALDAGLKFLGKEYKEIGKSGSGVFRSTDGLRQFRIDKTSIAGKHFPYAAHCHLEILEEGASKPIVINHIILLE